MRQRRLAWVVLAGIVGSGCAAERPEAAEPAGVVLHAPAVPGRVEGALYPAELVIEHQRELALGDSQVSALMEDMRTTQQELTPLAWRLGRAEEALSALLAGSRVDEEAAVTAARDVAAIEGELELAHLRLLIRMKNRLTEAQQAQLEAIR